MKRTNQEIAHAINRVAQERPVPLVDLKDLAGVSAETLMCWALEGRGGVFLDAVKRGKHWYSSRPAIERFKAARKLAKEKQPAGPA